MQITISGQSGSGKSTIGRALAKRLKYKYYDIGDFRRQMAKERGMTIEEFNKLGEKELFTDKEADDYAKNIGETEDNFVMQGRTAYYFVPKSVKIFLTVSSQVAAERVYNDKVSDRSAQQKTNSVEEQMRLLQERDASDILRYRKNYGITDFTDKKHFDLIFDTSEDQDIDRKVDKIMDFLKSKHLLKD